MAASSSTNPTRFLLLLSIVLCFLSISASARPCKTLFFVSSYSFSVKPLYPNPNSDNPSSAGFVTIIAEIGHQDSSTSGIFVNRRIFPAIPTDSEPQQIQPQKQQHGRLLPFAVSSSYDISSLRDRTKDILSVVVALLFGIGCGALTAATMYLIWSLFSSSRYYDYGSEDDDSDNNDDVFNPKKKGYVKIPEPIKEEKKAGV